MAVGETLRRLVGMLLNRRVAQRASALLGGFQLGVAVPGGSEAIVHAVRHRISAQGHDCRLALLSLDFRNAFNLVHRQAILRAVRTHFPELEGYVRTCYAQHDDPHLWCGELLLRSRTGCQQGDPLGPLLFSLVLYDLVSDAPRPPSADDDPALACHLMFYLDDGLIMGTHSALRHYLAFFGSSHAKRHGLYLRPDKCEVWWPTAPEQAVQELYPRDVRLSFTPVTRVMQAPVGECEAVTAALTDEVRSLRPFFDALAALEDAHVAFTLLRSCFSACRVMYWLRVTPTQQAAPAAALFDEYIAQAFRSLVGNDLDAELWPELQLPVRSAQPTFGVGLSSAAAISSAAYLASVALTQTIVQRFIPSPSQALLSDQPHTKEALQDWHGRIDKGERLSAVDLLAASPRQKELAAPVFAAAQSRITPGDLRRRAHRASLGLPHAKAWLNCAPSTGMRTYIADRDWRVWMRYHCHLPLFNTGYQCPRRGCDATITAEGDHLLHCLKGVHDRNAPTLWRHDGFVRELSSILAQAARSPKVECRTGAESRLRPDIRATRAGNGHDYFDVAFVNPLTSASRMEKVATTPATVLTSMATKKRAKYDALLGPNGTEDGNLIPVVLSTLGGWSKQADEYFRSVVAFMASRSQTPRSFFFNMTFQRLAACVVRFNVACLSEGVPLAY